MRKLPTPPRRPVLSILASVLAAGCQLDTSPTEPLTLPECTDGVTQCFLAANATTSQVNIREKVCCSADAYVSTYVIADGKVLGYSSRTLACEAEYTDYFLFRSTQDPARGPLTVRAMVTGLDYSYFSCSVVIAAPSPSK